MKKTIYIFIILTAFFCIPVSGFATSILIDYFTGNDPSNPSADLSELELIVNTWLIEKTPSNWSGDTIDLEFYAKVDFPSTTTTEGPGNLTLSYEFDDDESKSGTWSTDIAINLFSIKASRGYALYWLDPAATSGSWDTTDVGNKGISHLSTWVSVSEPPALPNPEPTTLLLFGIGLLGFAGISRRK